MTNAFEQLTSYYNEHVFDVITHKHAFDIDICKKQQTR